MRQFYDRVFNWISISNEKKRTANRYTKVHIQEYCDYQT